MILKATAKVNLSLDVLKKRTDGYHDVRMIMQMTGMYDKIELTAVKNRPGISFFTNLSYIPSDENNLAFKAAKMLMDEFSVTDGLDIDLRKFIPVAAGLAGGSSDAAQVLIGTNRIFGLGLDNEQLMERGQRIGADVPYCIMGGTALAEGLGEKLTPLPQMPDCFLLLAKPQVSVSTKSVYKALKPEEIKLHPDVDGMMEAIRDGNLDGIAGRMANVLEGVTAPHYPVIKDIEKCMTEAGALAAVMSGSGPTVFGIFRDEKKAKACRDTVGRLFPARVFLTKPYSVGGSIYGE